MNRWGLVAIAMVPFAACAVVTCGGAGEPTDDGGAIDAGADALDVALDVVFAHRAVAQACDASRPSGDPASGLDAGCKTDDDCDAGLNGRCDQTYLCAGCLANVCSYDTCESDDACINAVCACRGTPLNAGGANTCVPGNCRVDSDCPSGFCSPSLVPGCGVRGYYCRTPQDECVNDIDCTNGTGACAYDKSKKHWTCQNACNDI